MQDQTHTELELVDIHLMGGTVITVDVTAAIGDGLLDSDDCETTGDLVMTVAKAVGAGDMLPVVGGGLASILTSLHPTAGVVAPLAYVYRTAVSA